MLKSCLTGHPPRAQLRQFFTAPPLHGGQKAKRRKQNLRADNPQLPVRSAEKTEKILALTHFDQYYSQYFGKKWSSMRLAMLSRKKYCAVVNNFGDSEETCAFLESLGCINLTQEILRRQANYAIKEDGNNEIAAEDKASEILASDILVKSDSKTNQLDAEPEDVEVKPPSLDPSGAPARFIAPDESILGQNESVSLYDFVPTDTLRGLEDFVEESEYYDNYEKVDSKIIKHRRYDRLHIPRHLNVFTFPRSVPDMFPSPSVGVLGNTNYYCMDAGSLLPVLALDLEPGNDVLDMCAGPGGKSLLMLQTLFPRSLVCNDKVGTRLSRVGSVLEQFCGKDSGVGQVRNSVRLTRRDATLLHEYGMYDRILCDVPCFSDRHSVSTDADNIFSRKMIQNRLQLPKEQSNLLRSGLMYLKPGGSLVYSTCTLSPVQNEGVVNMALKALAEETSHEFVVDDLTDALRPFKGFVKIYGNHEGVKLGNLVVPYIINNFGPTYFCRITRMA